MHRSWLKEFKNLPRVHFLQEICVKFDKRHMSTGL